VWQQHVSYSSWRWLYSSHNRQQGLCRAVVKGQSGEGPSACFNARASFKVLVFEPRPFQPFSLLQVWLPTVESMIFLIFLILPIFLVFHTALLQPIGVSGAHGDHLGSRLGMLRTRGQDLPKDLLREPSLMFVWILVVVPSRAIQTRKHGGWVKT
jgi:hypothetical protein